MLIIGLGGALLAVALVALVVGLLAGSTGWLIASLVCTALAAGLLVAHLRAGRSGTASDPPADPADAHTAGADAAGKDTTHEDTTHEDTTREDTAHEDTGGTGAAATPAGVDDLPVWVIDGEPDYHRPHCERLTGADAEPVPRAQALEDGFTACGLCRPAEA